MQKVYLLLRNNHQSGPFSVDELLQHDLTPSDLVWEEGRSAGWSFPYEIASLKPFLHLEAPPSPSEKGTKQQKTSPQEFSPADLDAPFASKSVTSKNVYVSLPNHDHLHRDEGQTEHIEESLEQKADAIRKRAFAALEHGGSTDKGSPEHMSAETPYELETKLSRSTSEIGEDYSAWLYTQQIEKKKKARRKRSILIGGTTVSMIVLGFLLYKGIVVGNLGITEETAPVSETKKTEAMPTSLQQPQNVNEPIANDPSLPSPATDSTNGMNMNSAPLAKGKTPLKQVHNQTATLQKPIETLAKSETNVDSNKEAKASPIVDTEQIEKKGGPEVVVAAPKKKQTLGDKIGNFFDKFKSRDKKDKPENSEAKTGQAPVEREVKRRPEQAPSTTNIANLISISSNAPTENWMMGVQGLKLTLNNKSNETLKTAAVEIRYYNEDKDLLEKKVIYFNNVSPKSSQTVAAPDHRLAERTDFQLVSAVAKEDGYVKQ